MWDQRPAPPPPPPTPLRPQMLQLPACPPGAARTAARLGAAGLSRAREVPLRGGLEGPRASSLAARNSFPEGSRAPVPLHAEVPRKSHTLPVCQGGSVMDQEGPPRPAQEPREGLCGGNRSGGGANSRGSQEHARWGQKVIWPLQACFPVSTGYPSTGVLPEAGIP